MAIRDAIAEQREENGNHDAFVNRDSVSIKDRAVSLPVVSGRLVSETFDEVLEARFVLKHVVVVVSINEEGYIPLIVVVEVFGGGNGVCVSDSWAVRGFQIRRSFPKVIDVVLGHTHISEIIEQLDEIDSAGMIGIDANLWWNIKGDKVEEKSHWLEDRPQYQPYVGEPLRDAPSYSLACRGDGSVILIIPAPIYKGTSQRNLVQPREHHRVEQLEADSDDGLQASFAGERVVASIERVSDDLHEKVDQFKEREDALRERFQEAMN